MAVDLVATVQVRARAEVRSAQFLRRHRDARSDPQPLCRRPAAVVEGPGDGGMADLPRARACDLDRRRLGLAGHSRVLHAPVLAEPPQTHRPRFLSGTDEGTSEADQGVRLPEDRSREGRRFEDRRRETRPFERGFMTRIGLLDSGLGLLGPDDALVNLAPDADLVLSMDPDFTPYGRLSTEALEQRALHSAGVLAEWEPDAIVIACNTASVQALEAVRPRYEPAIP